MQVYTRKIIKKPSVLYTKFKNHQKNPCFTSKSVEWTVFNVVFLRLLYPPRSCCCCFVLFFVFLVLFFG